MLLTAQEARRNGEERLQLRERGRYEYRLKPASGVSEDFQLLRHSGVQPSRVESEDGDWGLIEPQDHCGLLPLTVIRRGDAMERPLARGCVEVRSLKIGYREHYRGMLSYIAEKCAGLLLDCRAPTRLRLDTLWQQDSRILEQQLEFLRYTVESPAFRAAVDEVLRNPHRRLEDEREERDISRPFKPSRDLARQIAVAARRAAVPGAHPLHATIQSLPARVSVQARTDFLDTAENRFAKMVLAEFRDFLAEVAVHWPGKQRKAVGPRRSGYCARRSGCAGRWKRNYRGASFAMCCRPRCCRWAVRCCKARRATASCCGSGCNFMPGHNWPGKAVRMYLSPGRATWQRCMSTGCSSSWRHLPAAFRL